MGIACSDLQFTNSIRQCSTHLQIFKMTMNLCEGYCCCCCAAELDHHDSTGSAILANAKIQSMSKCEFIKKTHFIVLSWPPLEIRHPLSHLSVSLYYIVFKCTQLNGQRSINPWSGQHTKTTSYYFAFNTYFSVKMFSFFPLVQIGQGHHCLYSFRCDDLLVTIFYRIKFSMFFLCLSFFVILIFSRIHFN